MTYSILENILAEQWLTLNLLVLHVKVLGYQ